MTTVTVTMTTVTVKVHPLHWMNVDCGGWPPTPRPANRPIQRKLADTINIHHCCYYSVHNLIVMLLSHGRCKGESTNRHHVMHQERSLCGRDDVWHLLMLLFEKTCSLLSVLLQSCGNDWRNFCAVISTDKKAVWCQIIGHFMFTENKVLNFCVRPQYDS